MADKILNATIQHKYDTAANWDTVKTTFIPMPGELIIYAAEKNENNEETLPTKLKVGDGTSTLENLPFINASEKAEELLATLDAALKSLTDVVDTKLPSNQGSDNADKYMRVDAEGNLVPDRFRVRYGTSIPTSLEEGELFVVYTP